MTACTAGNAMCAQQAAVLTEQLQDQPRATTLEPGLLLLLQVTL